MTMAVVCGIIFTPIVLAIMKWRKGEVRFSEIILISCSFKKSNLQKVKVREYAVYNYVV